MTSLEGQALGVTRMRQGRVSISINTDPGPDKNGLCRSYYLLSTLLHECTHAYLREAACRGLGERGCEVESCKNFWESECGEQGGHGDVWQLLAWDVEARATALLDIPFDLGREDAVVEHYEVNDKLISEDCVTKCFPGKRLEQFAESAFGKISVRLVAREDGSSRTEA